LYISLIQSLKSAFHVHCCHARQLRPTFDLAAEVVGATPIIKGVVLTECAFRAVASHAGTASNTAGGSGSDGNAGSGGSSGRGTEQLRTSWAWNLTAALHVDIPDASFGLEAGDRGVQRSPQFWLCVLRGGVTVISRLLGGYQHHSEPDPEPDTYP
jgi:hypothetical protein